MFCEDSVKSCSGIARDPLVFWAVAIDFGKGAEVEDDSYTLKMSELQRL